MSGYHTVIMKLDLSVVDGTDEEELADQIVNYLTADEINGLPESLFSVDGIEVERKS